MDSVLSIYYVNMSIKNIGFLMKGFYGKDWGPEGRPLRWINMQHNIV